jgi:hypothetical protein
MLAIIETIMLCFKYPRKKAAPTPQRPAYQTVGKSKIAKGNIKAPRAATGSNSSLSLIDCGILLMDFEKYGRNLGIIVAMAATKTINNIDLGSVSMIISFLPNNFQSKKH